MNLFLLRHAEAGDAPSDDVRELTQHGQSQARAVAAGLLALDLGLTTIISSPLPRAVPTADPTAKALGVALQIDDALGLGSDVQAALSLLPSGEGRTLLVGHEPQLSEIARVVTGGRVHMRKATLALIEVESIDPPSGALAWLLSWRHLKRLGS